MLQAPSHRIFDNVGVDVWSSVSMRSLVLLFRCGERAGGIVKSLGYSIFAANFLADVQRNVGAEGSLSPQDVTGTEARDHSQAKLPSPAGVTASR